MYYVDISLFIGDEVGKAKHLDYHASVIIN